MGVRGNNPVSRDLSSVFLTQFGQQMDPTALLKHSSYLLPHSKMDMEQFLGTTYKEAMEEVPGWWKSIANVKDSETINFELKFKVQRNVVAQPTAPGAPADISEQTEEKRNYTLIRIQTDFKFRNENFQFGDPEAEREVAMKVGAVRAAVETAYIRQILEALFLENDYYRDFKARYSTRSISTIEDALRWTRDVTFFVQKGGIRGMAEVYGRIRDAVRDAGGMEPDHWILPNGFLLTTSIQSFDAVQYKDRGKLIYDHLGRLDESLRTFHGVTMVEAPPINVDNEIGPIDPLRGILSTGRYFVMRCTTHNLKEYQSFKRNIETYSHDTDNEKTPVTLSGALSNTHRWGEDGYLLSDHYTLASRAVELMKAMGFAVPEDPNETIQVDMFIYRDEDGDYKVADIFGHMEEAYLNMKDIRRCVETAYNSYDAELTQLDKNALAAGLKLIDELSVYNLTSAAAQVFREAIRISNPDADPNTGNVRPNMYGFVQNMPTVEETQRILPGRTTPSTVYVLRAADGETYITFNGTVGTTTDIDEAYAQTVPFRPYGMGSIPGMLTLSSIARGEEGSPERMGYRDKTLNIARDFIIAFEKVYEKSVTIFGKDHISFRADRLPDFWKSGNDRNDSMILFGTQHFDIPKYPFFITQSAGEAEALTEEEQDIKEDLESSVASLRNEDEASFLRRFLDDPRAYRIFLREVRRITGQSFTDLYNEKFRGKSASLKARSLSRMIKKLEEEGVRCVGVTDGDHVSLRLVVSNTEFNKDAPWNLGLRPRSVICPHTVYPGDATAFRNDSDNNRDVNPGNVLATYVVDKDTPAYSPDVSAAGPMTGMDLDEVGMDSFRNVTNTDDKNYTGAYSSNLERKYREASDKYSSLAIHRAIAQLFLLSQTTGSQFQRFDENDVHVPADILGSNPQVQYEVKAVIPIRGGGQTVNIYRYAPNFVIENMGVARETRTSFAEYMLGIVEDVRNYTIIPAGWCNHYIKGGDLSPLTIENMNVNTGEFGGSTMYMLLPADSTDRKSLDNPIQKTQFFTGRYDEVYWDVDIASDLANYAGIKWGRPTHPSAVYYSYLFRLHEIAERLHVTAQTHLPYADPELNGVIFKTQWYEWEDGTGGFTKKIQNEDIFGKNGVYTGCGDDRNGGKIFMCAHAEDNCM